MRRHGNPQIWRSFGSFRFCDLYVLKIICLFNKNLHIQGLGLGLVVQCLPSTCGALGSISNIE